MQKSPITGIAINSFKTLIIHLFKLIAILFGWAMKCIAMVLNQFANLIEKIILKKH